MDICHWIQTSTTSSIPCRKWDTQSPLTSPSSLAPFDFQSWFKIGREPCRVKHGQNPRSARKADRTHGSLNYYGLLIPLCSAGRHVAQRWRSFIAPPCSTQCFPAFLCHSACIFEFGDYPLVCFTLDELVEIVMDEMQLISQFGDLFLFSFHALLVEYQTRNGILWRG